MWTYGHIFLYGSAPVGRKVQIIFLVTQANQESLMILWSNLKILGILASNFPEVINKKEAKNVEEKNEPQVEGLDKVMQKLKKNFLFKT